jgi:hypothetical protein
MSDEVISIEEVIAYSLTTFPGLIEAWNWGERSLFYNADRRLPKGTYFLTFKERRCKRLRLQNTLRRLPTECWHFEDRVY